MTTARMDELDPADPELVYVKFPADASGEFRLTPWRSAISDGLRG